MAKKVSTGKAAPKGGAEAASLRCRSCSAPHGGVYGAYLCGDCLLKAASGCLRPSAGRYLCAACNGAVVTDAYGAIRCEHWCFTAHARSIG
jgi:hypothetical protein